VGWSAGRPRARDAHRVRAEPGRALALGQLRAEAGQVGRGELEDGHGGGRRRRLGREGCLRRLGGRHGRRGLVLHVRVRCSGWVPLVEEAAVDEGHDGDRDAPAEVGPRVDEVQAGEAVRDVVLHAHAQRHATALEVGHLEQQKRKGQIRLRNDFTASFFLLLMESIKLATFYSIWTRCNNRRYDLITKT
jgi:hypothetical protein